MSKRIPDQQRSVVKVRDNWRCVRCGSKGSEWHHRRSRSVVDDHRHCACNGVWLCKACHDWTHAHPFEARALGLIVSRAAIPTEHPVKCVRRGWVNLTCIGDAEPNKEVKDEW